MTDIIWWRRPAKTDGKVEKRGRPKKEKSDEEAGSGEDEEEKDEEEEANGEEEKEKEDGEENWRRSTNSNFSTWSSSRDLHTGQNFYLVFFVWCSIDPFCNNDFSFCCHSLNSICYNNWINIQPQPWLHRINVFWLQHWQVIPRYFLLYPSGALATSFSRFGAMLSLFYFDSVFILQNRIVNWWINRDKH